MTQGGWGPSLPPPLPPLDFDLPKYALFFPHGELVVSIHSKFVTSALPFSPAPPSLYICLGHNSLIAELYYLKEREREGGGLY